MQSYSEVLKVKTLECEFGGENHNSAQNTYPKELDFTKCEVMSRPV